MARSPLRDVETRRCENGRSRRKHVVARNVSGDRRCPAFGDQRSGARQRRGGGRYSLCRIAIRRPAAAPPRPILGCRGGAFRSPLTPGRTSRPDLLLAGLSAQPTRARCASRCAKRRERRRKSAYDSRACERRSNGLLPPPARTHMPPAPLGRGRTGRLGPHLACARLGCDIHPRAAEGFDKFCSRMFSAAGFVLAGFGARAAPPSDAGHTGRRSRRVCTCIYTNKRGSDWLSRHHLRARSG